MQAGSLQRRLPRAGWQDGRVVSQITHPSRLVGQSSGGEVQKHQLDTRVKNEPGRGGGGGGPVSEPQPPLPSAVFLGSSGGWAGPQAAAVAGPAAPRHTRGHWHPKPEPSSPRGPSHLCPSPGRAPMCATKSHSIWALVAHAGVRGAGMGAGRQQAGRLQNEWAHGSGAGEDRPRPRGSNPKRPAVPPAAAGFPTLGLVHPHRPVTFILGPAAGSPGVSGSWRTHPIRRWGELMLSKQRWRLRRLARIDPPHPHRIKSEIMSCNCHKGDLNPALSETTGRWEAPEGGRAAAGAGGILGRC